MANHAALNADVQKVKLRYKIIPVIILMTGFILCISMYIGVCIMHLYVIQIVFFKIPPISCTKGQKG